MAREPNVQDGAQCYVLKHICSGLIFLTTRVTLCRARTSGPEVEQPQISIVPGRHHCRSIANKPRNTGAMADQYMLSMVEYKQRRRLTLPNLGSEHFLQ